MAILDKKVEIPLVVIVGPTASGKTSLAIRLAVQFNGEIISADSRAVYRGCDVGTAKPTIAEQKLVPHWGIDIVEPSERFTAADFKQYADKKIEEIRSRGHIPFLVGGTGLYVDCVVYDYQFPKTIDDQDSRAGLENKTLDELYEHCDLNNVTLPENHKNKRYVINAILRHGSEIKRRTEPLGNTIIVGIATEKAELMVSINSRAHKIFDSGVIMETKQLAEKYGWQSEALTSNVYRIVRSYLDGNISRDQAIDQSAKSDWHLAKRQMTWFRRSEHIVWLPIEDAYTYCARLFASSSKS